MRIPRALHRWNLSPAAAVRLQRRLADRVIESPLRRPPRLVAAGDVAFSPDGRELTAAWLVWDVRERAVREVATARRPVRFPYVPGLLSFREAPALLAAARRLVIEPDVFLLDGQGRAHPRRFGLACHVGVLLDRPAIGCGKTLLCGRYDEPGHRFGASTPLLDDGEIIGRAVRTRPGARAVYVSIGHRVELAGAVRAVLACCGGVRIPEPARLAHQAVTRAARSA